MPGVHYWTFRDWVQRITSLPASVLLIRAQRPTSEDRQAGSPAPRAPIDSLRIHMLANGWQASLTSPSRHSQPCSSGGGWLPRPASPAGSSLGCSWPLQGTAQTAWHTFKLRRSLAAAAAEPTAAPGRRAKQQDGSGMRSSSSNSGRNRQRDGSSSNGRSNGSRGNGGRGSGGGGGGNSRGRPTQPLQSSREVRANISTVHKDLHTMVAAAHNPFTAADYYGPIHHLQTHGAWRVFGVGVPLDADPGKDDVSVHAALVRAVSKRIGCPAYSQLPSSSMSLVRKSFDARRGKQWVYVVDVAAGAAVAAGARGLFDRPGLMERLPEAEPAAPARSRTPPAQPPTAPHSRQPVVVVGAGPAGLFAALTAAEAGLPVVLLERGQPVEQRGRDIGALCVRAKLNPDSNYCYGEGGAGTWSDGKLTTRIGRNSDPVRRVLQALHDFGAPDSVLVAGKPHLGTERLVRILKAFREHLLALGVQIRFGAAVADIMVQGGRAVGVRLRDGSEIKASAVVLAVGHSARPLYTKLLDHGVTIHPKPFALGFRIEHPQSVIDVARYGPQDAAGVMRGKGRLPVADYSFAAQILNPSAPSTDGSGSSLSNGSSNNGGSSSSASANGSSSSTLEGVATMAASTSGRHHQQGDSTRHVYSFCMCPGGQVVCTSTTDDSLCVNGMSFSHRNSVWANAALVVAVQPSDWAHLLPAHGPLAGVALQEEAECEAAVRGGGRFVAPVQRVTDFLAGRVSTGSLPSSSYKLGVRSAPLHDLYSPAVTKALEVALGKFDRQLPGFVSDVGLLHGVETRTSAPVCIERRQEDSVSVSMEGLFPCGEGAGYAGGIVSAAVDGLRVGEAVIRQLLGTGAAGALDAEARTTPAVPPY